jgi:hypothetical protein
MMKKKLDTKPDMDLTAFFDAAKDADTQPNAAFMEAVLADAMNQTQTRVKSTQQLAPAQPWWASLFSSIGGWQTAAALTASAFLGITAGYAAPSTLDYFKNTQTTAETYSDDSFSVASDIEALFQEG